MQSYEDHVGMPIQIRKLARTVLALSIFYFCGVPIASACIAPRTFDIVNMDLADVIFRGRIETYEELPKEYATAKLRFVVLETYKGPQEVLSWDAVWQNSTFEIPKDLSAFTKSFGREFIVGLVKTPTPIRMIGSYYRPGVNQELLNQLFVLQAPCSPPYMFGVNEGHLTWIMFGNSPDGIAKVEDALRERGMIK